MPSVKGKLRKLNALCPNQSAFSNFTFYVMKQAMDNIPSRSGNGIQEVRTDAVVAPHPIYQVMKSCHPYALSEEGRISLKNHSDRQLSMKQVGKGSPSSGTGQWEETLTGK